MFSAHGPVSDVPFSKCASGTGIVWSVRPGKACAGVIIPGVFRPNILVTILDVTQSPIYPLKVSKSQLPQLNLEVHFQLLSLNA
jgi:hypothetical protein